MTSDNNRFFGNRSGRHSPTFLSKASTNRARLGELSSSRPRILSRHNDDPFKDSFLFRDSRRFSKVELGRSKAMTAVVDLTSEVNQRQLKNNSYQAELLGGEDLSASYKLSQQLTKDKNRDSNSNNKLVS